MLKPFPHSWAKRLLSPVVFALLLTSCTTAPKVTSPGPQFPDPIVRRDTTHKVAPGETFWRISQMYDVPVANILQANRMTNPSELRMGQELFIPNASRLRPVISLYPNNKWRYIIVHHSATEVGSSLSFHNAHLQRGWDRGVGYHFVIDNASNDKEDGQIEVSPRWLKQQDGAHTKAGDMNLQAIGICLVGNFNEDDVTGRQMDALVHLVQTLKDYYRIPDQNIMGHRHVPGAATECPGLQFPWNDFKQRVK